MSVFIHSTASAAIDFEVYADKPTPVAQVIKTIHIKGAANVIDKFSVFTPTGIVTEISDEDYEDLKKNPLFNDMVKNGFLKATGSHNLDTKDLQKADASAQITNDNRDAHGVRQTPVTAETESLD